MISPEFTKHLVISQRILLRRFVYFRRKWLRSWPVSDKYCFYNCSQMRLIFLLCSHSLSSDQIETLWHLFRKSTFSAFSFCFVSVIDRGLSQAQIRKSKYSIPFIFFFFWSLKCCHKSIIYRIYLCKVIYFEQKRFIYKVNWKRL